MLLVNLPVEILLLVGDNLDLRSLSHLSRACRHIHVPLEHHLYHRDARARAYALYWACYSGFAGTARKSLRAGASPDSKWLVSKYTFSSLADAAEIPSLRILFRGALLDDPIIDLSAYMTGDRREDRFVDLGANKLQSGTRMLLATKGLGKWYCERSRDQGRCLGHLSEEKRALFADACINLTSGPPPQPRLDIKVYQCLHLAVVRQHTTIVRILLEHGANVNVVSSSLCRCRYHSSSLLWMEHAYPALHLATVDGCTAMARLLMEHDPKLSIQCSPAPMVNLEPHNQDNTGAEQVTVVWSALNDCALACKTTALARAILEACPAEKETIGLTHYSGLDVVDTALCSQSWDVLAFLVETGAADLDKPRRRNVPLLYLALLVDKHEMYPVLGSHRPFESAHFLVKAKADVTLTFDPAAVKDADRWVISSSYFSGPWTILHAVAYSMYYTFPDKHMVECNEKKEAALKAILEAALKANVDINARDGHGNTPLHVAAYRGNGPTAARLIEAGADPNVGNNAQLTPLDMVQIGRAPLVAVLQILAFFDCEDAIERLGAKDTSQLWVRPERPHERYYLE